MTDFPPPAGFDGYENRDYDDLEDPDPYFRNCTEEEAAILTADAAIDRAAERAEEEQLRDAWFEVLRDELPDVTPHDVPTCASAATGPSGK